MSLRSLHEPPLSGSCKVPGDIVRFRVREAARSSTSRLSPIWADSSYPSAYQSHSIDQRPHYFRRTVLAASSKSQLVLADEIRRKASAYK